MPVADLRPALRTYLLADTSIFAAVGGDLPLPRIFPTVLPEGVILPSIVYARISGLGDPTMTGPSGLNRQRIQIDAWAQSANDADNLARLVKDRLDGFSGPMGFGGSPEEFITVQGIFWDSQRDDYDSDSKLHRASADFLVWLSER